MKRLAIVSIIFLSAQLFSQITKTEEGSMLQLRTFQHVNDLFEEKPQDSLPPVTTGKIFTELLMGNMIGMISIFPSYLVGVGIGSLAGEDQQYFSGAGLLTVLLAYPFSLTLGVYVIGNVGVGEGSYWTTFLGTLGGIGVALGIGAIGSKLHDNQTLYGIALLCPSVGAVVGYNSSRRLESNSYSFKVEQTNYSILKPDFSFQLFRVNF